MTLHNENPATLAERVADLLHDTAILDYLVQCAMESARARVSHFSRIAMIARYACTDGHGDADRLEIVRSIRELAEQYEKTARSDRESLASAYAYRKATRPNDAQCTPLPRH